VPGYSEKRTIKQVLLLLLFYRVKLDKPIPSVFFFHLFQRECLGDKWYKFFYQPVVFFCHLTKSVKALTETQSTDQNQ